MNSGACHLRCHSLKTVFLKCTLKSHNSTGVTTSAFSLLMTSLASWADVSLPFMPMWMNIELINSDSFYIEEGLANLSAVKIVDIIVDIWYCDWYSFTITAARTLSVVLEASVNIRKYLGWLSKTWHLLSLARWEFLMMFWGFQIYYKLTGNYRRKKVREVTMVFKWLGKRSSNVIWNSKIAFLILW